MIMKNDFLSRHFYIHFVDSNRHNIEVTGITKTNRQFKQNSPVVRSPLSLIFVSLLIAYCLLHIAYCILPIAYYHFSHLS